MLTNQTPPFPTYSTVLSSYRHVSALRAAVAGRPITTWYGSPNQSGPRNYKRLVDLIAERGLFRPDDVINLAKGREKKNLLNDSVISLNSTGTIETRRRSRILVTLSQREATAAYLNTAYDDVLLRAHAYSVAAAVVNSMKPSLRSPIVEAGTVIATEYVFNTAIAEVKIRKFIPPASGLQLVSSIKLKMLVAKERNHNRSDSSLVSAVSHTFYFSATDTKSLLKGVVKPIAPNHYERN